MRTILGAIIVGLTLVTPGPVVAGGFVLGRSLGWSGPPPVVVYAPPVPVYPYAYPYGAPYYPGPAYVPFAADRSYFRPYAPYGWNASRNWRDTWQDDGVKVHSYTWR